MEELLRVIVLGLVQGLTEFLPISSSGHLILTRELFGWEFSDDLTLDVALHLGTTIAVLIFFWREWLQMALSAVHWATKRPALWRPQPPYDQRLLLLLLIGSIPAAAVGFAFEGFVEEEVRSPLVVGAMLLLFAGALLAAERFGKRNRTIGSSGWLDAVSVGCAQAIALVPGVSRSGVTISASLYRDFNRVDAARFSFLLATPIIVGAGGLRVIEALAEGISGKDLGLMSTGTIVAAVSGWLAIRYLLRLVQTSSYAPFVAYRLLAGVFVLIYFTVR